MPPSISEFLARDHDRLDRLLESACAARAEVDGAAYEEFRRGLLRHVGMEEMILLPAAKRLSGVPVVLAERTRLDHGILTALLVPTPTPAIVNALRRLLTRHNEMEEREGGLYAQCETALGGETAAIFESLRNAREIPPAAHVDGAHVTAVIRRAAAAAGCRDVVEDALRSRP